MSYGMLRRARVRHEPAKPSAYHVRRVGRHLDESEERMVFHAALVQMFARRPRGRLKAVSVLIVLESVLLQLFRCAIKVYPGSGRHDRRGTRRPRVDDTTKYFDVKILTFLSHTRSMKYFPLLKILLILGLNETWFFFL